MIIDFHTHIFPEQICKCREKYFPFESDFKLLYDSPMSKLIGAKEMINSMDENEVDLSVIFGFPWKNSGTFKKHNDYIMESVQKYPNRFVGFCCFDTHNEEAVSETLRCINNGFSGVGELAFYRHGINKDSIEQLSPIMAICREKNLPILIHTNEPIGHNYPGKTPNTMMQIYKLIKKFPFNKIVLAHWGGGIFFFNLLKKDSKEIFRNVYFDTAAAPFLYKSLICKIAIQVIGKNKILFGSDFPLIKPSRYFDEFKQVELSDDEFDCICGKNAANLLNL